MYDHFGGMRTKISVTASHQTHCTLAKYQIYFYSCIYMYIIIIFLFISKFSCALNAGVWKGIQICMFLI